MIKKFTSNPIPNIPKPFPDTRGHFLLFNKRPVIRFVPA